MPDGLRIFYDASCGICTGAAARYGPIAQRRGFRLVPLQSDEAIARLNLPPATVPDEMKVETRHGRILGGVDALLYIARHIWWAWPAAILGHVPGIHAILKSIYRSVARRRHHLGCKLHNH